MTENDKKHLNMLEELLAYRAIGTIDEFKALKENERKCEDCAGCTNWLCDCANIRAKAIDEFAERLKLKYPYFVEDVGFVEANKMLHSAIDEIAEEMRGAE